MSPVPKDSKADSAFKSILKGEARDALIFSGSNLLNKFGGFLLIPLYMTKLGPEDFGVLAFVAIIGIVQSVVSTLSLDLGVTRHYWDWTESERPGNLGSIWTWSWISVIIGTIFTLLAVHLASPYLFRGTPFFPYLFLGILSNASANFLNIPLTIIRIRRIPVLYALYNFLSFSTSSGLAILFVVVWEKGLVGYLHAGLLAGAVMTFLSIIFMAVSARPGFTSPGLKAMVRISLPAIPSVLLSSFGSVLDRFLLGHFAGLHVLGIFSVAMKFVDGITSLHASLKLSFAPFLMKTISRDKETGRETVSRVVPFYAIVYFLVGMVISLFIQDIIGWINRAEYQSVGEWVPLLVGAAVLGCLHFYYTHGIFLANRTDLLWIPHAVSLAVLTVSSAILIRHYHMAGLVVTRYLAILAYLAVGLSFSQRLFPMPQRWGKLLAMIVAASGLTAAGLFLDRMGLPALVGMGGKGVLVAIYGFFCYRLMVEGKLDPSTVPFFRKFRFGKRSES